MVIRGAFKQREQQRQRPGVYLICVKSRMGAAQSEARWGQCSRGQDLGEHVAAAGCAMDFSFSSE